MLLAWCLPTPVVQVEEQRVVDPDIHDPDHPAEAQAQRHRGKEGPPSEGEEVGQHPTPQNAPGQGDHALLEALEEVVEVLRLRRLVWVEDADLRVRELLL